MKLLQREKQLSEITDSWVGKYNYYCLTLKFLAHVEPELMDLISSILKRKSNGKPIIIEWGITFNKKKEENSIV